ncbi:GTP-binding protein Rheb-like isoform X2 [Gordionus sp. m RMFG-2023]|uniref:GTP-binding protein Rheb-like isoform X2 n=1 Tax=Gordionus sp. m RMFG-2023 TaxID=3053472 RepID=UPI0031FDCC99
MPIKCRKICILGFRSVGKTSLIQQYLNGNFAFNYDPTIENTYTKILNIRGQEYEVNFIDTAGQDDTSLYAQSYFLGSHGYIIVYSISNLKSFEVASHIYERILRMTGKIQNLNPDLGSKTASLPLSNKRDKFTSNFAHTPLVLVGNKMDLNSQRVISRDMGKTLADSWGAVFFESSAQLNKKEIFINHSSVRFSRHDHL